MRTPGACGGVKWGQTSLSLRLGIKGIPRTAVEQESPELSLSRQVRNRGGRSSLKVVAVACISHPRKRSRAPCKAQTRDKESLSELFASSRIDAWCTAPKAKTKLNTPGNINRLCICDRFPKTVSSGARDNKCMPLQIAPKPPGTSAGPPPPPHPLPPARPRGLKAWVHLLEDWKTFARQGWSGAARGV